MNKFFLLLVVFNFLCLRGFGEGYPARPDQNGNIYDFAGLLSDQQRTSLEENIIAFEDTSHINIIIATVNSIEGYSSEDYAKRMAIDWGILKSSSKDDILLIFVERERVFEMVAGKDVRHIFTEVAERKIEKKYIEDNFRDNQHFQGISKVVHVIGGLASGDIKKADIYKESGLKVLWVVAPLFLFFMIIFPIVQFSALNKSHIGTRPIGFYSALSLMNTFGGTGRAGYNDFMNGTGKFKGYNSGGGGAGGAW